MIFYLADTDIVKVIPFTHQYSPASLILYNREEFISRSFLRGSLKARLLRLRQPGFITVEYLSRTSVIVLRCELERGVLDLLIFLLRYFISDTVSWLCCFKNRVSEIFCSFKFFEIGSQNLSLRWMIVESNI